MNDKESKEVDDIKKTGFNALSFKARALLGLMVAFFAFVAMNATVQKEISAISLLSDAGTVSLDEVSVNALAIKSTVALISIHPSMVSDVHSKLLNELKLTGIIPVDDPFVDYPLLDVIDLMNSSVDGLDSVTLAVYKRIDGGFDYSGVLTGTFNTGLINEYLVDKYKTKNTSSGLEINLINPETCEPSKSFVAHVTSQRIIFSTSPIAGIIKDRLDDFSESELDLDDWIDFSKDKLLSSILMVPGNIDQINVDPHFNDLYQRAKNTLSSYKTVYVGATLTSMPASIKLTTQLNSDDGAEQPGTYEEIASLLDFIKKTYREDFTFIRLISDSSLLNEDRENIHLHTRITSESIRALQLFPLELIAVFTKTNHFIDPYNLYDGFVDTEKLASKKRPFTEILTTTEIASYDNTDKTADVVAGPFGVSLERLGQDSLGTKTISVKAEAQSLPNHYGKGTIATMKVLHVLDKRGKEMLSLSRCGPNRQSSFILKGKNGNVSAFSKSYLKSYSNFDEIHEISGEITLSVPATKSESILGLSKGTIFNDNDLMFEIVKVTDNTVSYKLTGNQHRLLTIEGLNKAGLPLFTRSYQTNDYAIGFGQTGLLVYSGKLSKIKLITSKTTFDKVYPFTLSNSKPSSQNTITTKTITKFYDYGVDAFVEKYKDAPSIPTYAAESIASTTTGPFNVSIRKLGNHSKLNLTADIYAPRAYNLERNLSSVTFFIDSLKTSNGNVIRPPEGEVWSRPLYLKENQNLLYDYSIMSFDIKNLSNDGVSSISGHLMVTMSSGYKLNTLDNLVVGDTYHFDDVELMIISMSRGEMVFESLGETQRIIALKPLTSDNREIWLSDTVITNQPNWHAIMNYEGAPDKFALLLATNQSSHDYPFEIRVY